MPVVPDYIPDQVQNSAAPDVRFSADATASAFGAQDAQSLGNMGQSLERVGATATNIGIQQADMVNKAQARDALSSYETKVREKLTGDYLQRKSGDAVGLTKDAESFMNDTRDAAVEALPNDYQKNIFRDMEPRFRTQYMTHVMYHESQQMEAFHQQSVANHMHQATENFVLGLNDPDSRKQSEDTIRQDTYHLNSSRGHDVASQMADDAVSALYEKGAAAISQTQKGDAAMKFLNDNHSKFSEITFDKLSQKYQDQSNKETAQVAAIAISNNPNIKTLQQAQEFIDSQKMPAATAQLTESLVKTRMTEKDAAQKEQMKANTESVFQQALKDKNADVPTTYPDGSNIPMEELMKINKAKQDLIRDKSQAESKQEYGRLVAMPIDDFKKANLFESKGVLSTEDFNHLHMIQTEMLKGGKLGTITAETRNAAQSIMKTIPYFDVSRTAVPNAADRQVNAGRRTDFMADVENQLRALPMDERTPEKAKEIAEAAAADVVIKQGHWYNALTFGITGNVRDVTAKQYEIDNGKVADPDAPSKPQMPAPLQDRPNTGFDDQRKEFYQDTPSGRVIYDKDGNALGMRKKLQSPTAPTSFNSPQWNFAPGGEPMTDPGKLQSALPNPLKQYANDFVDAGRKYGVDPALLSAIAMHETGNGTSKAFKEKENAMGVSSNSGPISFSGAGGVKASIEHMARKIAGDPIYAPARHAGTIDSLASIYAPVGASNDPTNVNPDWSGGVKKYYDQLRNG